MPRGSRSNEAPDWQVDADASSAITRRWSHKPATSPSARAAATAKGIPTARTDLHSWRAPSARHQAARDEKRRHRHQQGHHHGDREHHRDGDAVLGDKIELLHDADAGRDKQQRQMREEAAAGIFHAILLQRPACQRNEAVTRQQQQQQKQKADHPTRQRQAEPAHDDLAGQLTQQNKAEARYHSLSAPRKLPQAIPANATAAYHHPAGWQYG